MIHEDPMYGSVELPDFVHDLVNTSVVQRLKGISQDAAPACCVPWPTASRYEHSLGVAYLATIAARESGLTQQEQELLIASAVLHDAGNPPFSHLSEPFLKLVTQHDRKSFLQIIARGTSVERILRRKLRLTLFGDVVQLVTGKRKPLSDVLHGSVDVDNLDSVARYWFMAKGGERLFDGPRIATLFRFQKGTEEYEWVFRAEAYAEVLKWRQARSRVYNLIYSVQYQAICSMLHRAMYLACKAGEINREFFLPERSRWASLYRFMQSGKPAAYCMRLGWKTVWRSARDRNHEAEPRILEICGSLRLGR